MFCRAESRRDQEEGGELDSHEEVRRFCVSKRDQEEGGELDSHEELDAFACPGEIKRREVELDPQESPRRDQEQGGGTGL